MAASEKGRNDPCPCGSGKKYKLCCGREPEFGSFISNTGDPFAELRQALERHLKDEPVGESEGFHFVSLPQNTEPLEDFQGLTPEQMHRLIYYPFESPEVVTFSEALPTWPQAPILSLFLLLVEAIGEEGLKTTELGNLPRQTTRKIAREYLGEMGYREETEFGGLNKEGDFEPLHTTRVIAELAGLVRKYKKRFILGRECRKLIAQGRWDAVYLALFRAYTEKFNWDYLLFREAPAIVRDSFLFSLHLLCSFGARTRKQVFYEDCFLRAFPSALMQVQPRPYQTAEDTLRFAYTQSMLIDFCRFFGLIEARPRVANRTLGMDYLIRKLPLLDQVVKFHF